MALLAYFILLASLVLGSFADDPEIFMNVSQIIQRWGYPVEEYEVTTEDGYILALQRIPHGRNDKISGRKRPVVFLQHGLLGCSTNWITNLPHQSLGFVLADHGFDVWLGNSRGSVYSLKHKTLSTDTDAFWDFSFDEFAKYDLPASIEFVLRVTKQRQVSYVGHSQGSTIGFAAFSKNQTLAAMVDLFVALAPVATVGNMKSPIKYLSYLSGGIQWLSWIFGVRDFLPSNFVTRTLGRYVCDDKIGSLWCTNILFVLCGHDKAQLNETRLPVYLAHTPAGTSVKNIVHFAQIYKSGKFQLYDYGWRYKNRRHYGQDYPAEYDLSAIKVPIAVFSAGQDWLADVKDTALLVSKLRSTVYHESIKEWDHLDFIWGMDAASVIYNDLERLLMKFKRRARARPI